MGQEASRGSTSEMAPSNPAGSHDKDPSTQRVSPENIILTSPSPRAVESSQWSSLPATHLASPEATLSSSLVSPLTLTSPPASLQPPSSVSREIVVIDLTGDDDEPGFQVRRPVSQSQRGTSRSKTTKSTPSSGGHQSSTPQSRRPSASLAKLFDISQEELDSVRKTAESKSPKEESGSHQAFPAGNEDNRSSLRSPTPQPSSYTATLDNQQPSPPENGQPKVKEEERLSSPVSSISETPLLHGNDSANPGTQHVSHVPLQNLEEQVTTSTSYSLPSPQTRVNATVRKYDPVTAAHFRTKFAEDRRQKLKRLDYDLDRNYIQVQAKAAKRRRAKPPLVQARTSTRKRKLIDVYDHYETIHPAPAATRRWPSSQYDTRSLQNQWVNIPFGFEYAPTISTKDILNFDQSDLLFRSRFESVADQVVQEQRVADEKKVDTAPHLDGRTTTRSGTPTTLASASRPLQAPSLADPNIHMLYFNIQGKTFGVYRDWVAYYAPLLYEVSHFATTMATAASPHLLQRTEPKVFGLFMSWLLRAPTHSAGLVSKHGEPAYQDRLMKLWILGKFLRMPQLQNDAMDTLEARRRIDQVLQTKYLGYIYENTQKGDGLRNYVMHICSREIGNFGGPLVQERFPRELVQEIEEARMFKTEEEQSLDMIDTKGYHVIESRA